MWAFIIPALALGAVALFAIAYYMARPDPTQPGPHPDDLPGGPRE